MTSSTILLRKAVANPFAYMPGDDPTVVIEDITSWYHLALEKAPLWCFSNWDFTALRSNNLPSSYPLRKITWRIAEDEEFDQTDPLATIHLADHLKWHLFARRVSLGSGGLGCPEIYRGEGELLQMEWSSAQSYQQIPDVDTGSFEDPNYWSEYWEIGSQVCELLEGIEAAKGKRERQKRKTELDAHLDDLGRKLAWGRPETGAAKPILDALFDQGRWLFDTCWKSLPVEPTETVNDLLAELGADPEDYTSWAIRLALPMLSVVEIEALRRQIAEPLGRRKPHTPPRRFTVFSIAHRLGVEAKVLARKLPPKSDARDFFAKKKNPNPINAE